MSTTISNPEISLSATDTSGLGSPYVNPNFLRHFRSVEQMCWSGRELQQNTASALRLDWHNNDDVVSLIASIEHFVSLQLLFEAMTKEKPLFEHALQDLNCKLDPRYHKSAEANCMAGWLQIGVKINIIKARGLMDAFERTMKTIDVLLASNAEAACKARDRLTHEVDKAAVGSSSWSLNFDLITIDKQT